MRSSDKQFILRFHISLVLRRHVAAALRGNPGDATLRGGTWAPNVSLRKRCREFIDHATEEQKNENNLL